MSDTASKHGLTPESPIGAAHIATHGLLDALHESVVVRDMTGEITAFNSASEKLYGLQREQVVGRQAHIVLKTQLPDSAANVESMLLATGRWEGEITRTTAKGLQISLESRWVLQRDDRGAPLCIVETSIDLTGRKRVEAALQAADLRYTNLFQAMAASFWELDFASVGDAVKDLIRSGVKDLGSYFREHPEVVREMMRNTRVVDVNEETVALFGNGSRNGLRASVEPFWPDASTEVYANAILAAFARKPNYSAETRLRRLDGSEFDCLFTACFPPEAVDRGALLIGVIDITIRKQAQLELEQSESRFRTLFDATAVSFWQIDTSGTNRMFAVLREQGVTDLNTYINAHPEVLRQALAATIIVDANDSAVRLYGAKHKSELLGPATIFDSPRHNEGFRGSIEAGFRGEASYLTQTAIETFDGREVPIIYFTTAPPELRRQGTVFVGHIDISDQINAQASLTRMQNELAHATRIAMLGELTASIAHEVNQPLSAIVTNGEAGARWLSRDPPEIDEARALVGRMVTDARRAASVVGRVRDMATGSPPSFEPVDVNAVLQDALIFVANEIQRHGALVERQFSGELCLVRADRVQLQQVAVNLIVNALQAMSEFPDRVSRIVLRTTQTTEAVIIDVEDSGPGVPERALERLFESFYTTKSTGMGMGLSISRSILESHGGSLTAENIPNAGARFTLALPICSEATRAAKPIG